MTSSRAKGARRASGAFRFVLLIGVVSLFSDMTHEGARSITGPFLASLGASAVVISAVAGFGELLGYVLRFVFGVAADRTGRYWPITISGYVLQMAVVPALALATNWPVAAVLIMAERTGRAIRNPARDAMLAHAAGELGRGRVFGIREALDAAGGMVGPLIVAVVLALHGGYRGSFAVLLIPAVLTLVVLIVARIQYARPSDLEAAAGVDEQPAPRRLPRAFWIYSAAMGLVALGYADYPLIAYHFTAAHVLASAWVPVLYAVAMAAEAVASLVLGPAFDRFGMATVVAATLATAAFAPLVFLGNTTAAVLGMVLWGVGMAAQESIVKAAVTGMVSRKRRATAYGLFDTVFGICWFLGSIVLGVLYNASIPALVLFSALTQLAAVPLLLATRKALAR
jgi:MFS family permease